MKITIGKTAGFCYGVKNAVDGAKEASKNTNGKIYGLGEIVHNKEVVNDLENMGIEFIKDIKDAKENVIIRAHGVDKKIYLEAKNMGINVLDFTCPNVKKVHDIASEYAKEGYYIILFGDKNHPENIGTVSYCENGYYVIKKQDEIEKLIQDIIGKRNELNTNKVLIISQTTYNNSNFVKYSNIIKKELEKNNIEVIIQNTICKSTEIRQKEVEKMSKENEYMIIIGGKNSSNTNKLYEIASMYCKNVVCVEREKELDLEEIRKYELIGIMAGASTPRQSIDRVYNKIIDIEKNTKIC